MTFGKLSPNLFVVGAMKAGSTSLHEYLAVHPRIFMSREKEPGFFVPELWGRRDEAEYASLFSEAGDCCYRGESSTHYAKLPTYIGVPERIRRFCPEARIIYITRDPVERTISHYLHAVRDVHLGREYRPPLDAIRASIEYTAFSDYAEQLRPYFAAFPESQIKVVTLEALRSQPGETMGDLFAWLGLPPCEQPPARAHNVAPESSVRVAGRGTLNAIRYTRWWGSISGYVPSVFKRAAIRRAYVAAEMRLGSDEREAVSRLLFGEFRYEDRIRRLECMLGRDFREWQRQD